MFKVWPPKRERTTKGVPRKPWPQTRPQTCANLNNLHVIPTTSTSIYKSLTEIPLCDTAILHEQKQNPISPSKAHLKTPSNPLSKKMSKYDSHSAKKTPHEWVRMSESNSHGPQKNKGKSEKRSYSHDKTAHVSEKSSHNSETDFHDSGYYQELGKSEKKKKRRHGRQGYKSSKLTTEDKSVYRWVNRNKLKNTEEDKSDIQNNDIGAEDCFEEVEVASYEAESQQEIPVSFRKSKVCYLNYKKKRFFKPKIYNISQEQITISCVNATKPTNFEDISENEFEAKESDVQIEEGDLETEADVEGKDVDPKGEVQPEKIDIGAEVVDDSDATETDETVPENIDGESNVIKKTAEVKEKVESEHDTNKRIETLQKKADDKSNTNKKIETLQEKVDDISDINKKIEAIPEKVNESNAVEKTSAESGKALDKYNSIQQPQDIESDDDSVVEVYPDGQAKFALKIYKTCIKDSPYVHQGKSLIQRSIDTSKSHLIGLEFLIEVQNTSKNAAVKYFCALCDEDIKTGKFQSIDIIGHINAYGHITKYLVKRFPTYGFRENSGYDNIVTLQNVCKEINRKTGYYFMCITDIDNFSQYKEEMQQLILDAEHLKEQSANTNVGFIEEMLESVLSEEIKDVLLSVVHNVVSESFKRVSSTSKKENKTKSLFSTTKNSAISSYLKLSFISSKDKKFKGGKAKVLAKVSNVPTTTVKPIVSSTAKVSNMPKVIPTKEVALLPEIAALNKVTPAPKVAASSKHITPLKNTVSAKVTRASKVIPKKDPVKKYQENSEYNQLQLEAEEKNLSVKAAPKAEHKVVKRNLVVKNKWKAAMLKPSVHSKHCSKRILTKESARVTSKTSVNNERTSGVSLKTNLKQKPVVKSLNTSVSKTVEEKKDTKKEEFKKYSKNFPIRSQEHAVKKAASVKKASPMSSRLLEEELSTYRKVKIKVEKSPEIEIIEEIPRNVSTKSDSSTRKSSESSYKRIVRRVSKSPKRHLITSPLRLSPTRRVIKSPLNFSPTRHVIKSPLRISPLRRRSRTPSKRRPRSPGRKHSRSPSRRTKRPIRSPLRKYSRSPIRRQSKSPFRLRSRSPFRRYSRSPIRKHSRSSSRRRSRSPGRRYSRSPHKRNSRSPPRRNSRSPYRRHSRSPQRRHSRSPQRRHSKSPQRRHSRSPQRRHSRSPVKRRLSPARRKSISPYRRYSKSPIRHRSPDTRTSKSPIKRHSSPLSKYKNTFRAVSPYEHSRDLEVLRDTSRHFSHSKSPQRSFGKHLSRYDKSEYKRSACRSISPSSIHEKFIPFLNSLSGQDIDLDPVSDEDESNYFNTLDILQSADCKMSAPKIMLAEFLKKFSSTDANPNDITVKKFMQFMQQHSSEIQEMMGSQSIAKPTKLTSNVQDQNSFLQQYLLQSLAGKLQQGSVTSSVPFSPSVSNVPPNYTQSSFVPNHPSTGFGHPAMMPGPSPPQPTHTQSQVFPPNLSIPPPNQFPPMNQQPQIQQPQHSSVIPPAKIRVPPELLFKDLKATVNKLFGPSSGPFQDAIKPDFVTESDLNEFDLHHMDAQKYVASGQQKNMFNPSDQNMNYHGASTSVAREETQYNCGPGQFYNSIVDVEQQQSRPPNLPVPPPNAKVAFCDLPSGLAKGNLFPVLSRSQGSSGMNSQSARSSVSDVKVSLAQRLASVLVKVGMIDVPAPLLQEMLMKIGAFSSSPPQDITEAEIVSILKRLGYL